MVCLCVSVPSPVKRAVRLCAGEVGMVDSEGYCAALAALLQHGLKMLDPSPSSPSPSSPSSPSPCSYDKLLWKLKLAEYIPVSTLVCTCEHIDRSSYFAADEGSDSHLFEGFIHAEGDSDWSGISCDLAPYAGMLACTLLQWGMFQEFKNPALWKSTVYPRL